MNVCWLGDGWSGFIHWIESDPAMAKRIVTLVEDIRQHPFTGLGKPEPLR
jgi:toxin YoeB